MEPPTINSKCDLVRDTDDATLPFDEAKNRTERVREVACSGKNGANIRTNHGTENFESITLRVRNMGIVTVKKEPGTEEDFEVSYSLKSLLEQCDFQTSLPAKQHDRDLKSPTRLRSSKDGSVAGKPRKRLENVISSLKSAKTKDGHHTKKLKAPENKHVTTVTTNSRTSQRIDAAPKSVAPPSTRNIIDTRLIGPKDRNVPQIVDVRSLATVPKAPINNTTAYKHTYVGSPQLSVQQSQGVLSTGGKQVINIAKVNASGTCAQGSNTQSKSVAVPAPLNIRFVLPSLVPFNKDYFQKALQAALASIGSSSLQLDPNQLQQAIQAALTAVITSTPYAATNKNCYQPIHLPVTSKASAVTCSQITAKTVSQHSAMQMSHWQPQRTTKKTVSSTAQVSIPPSSHYPVKVVIGGEKSQHLPKSLLLSPSRPVCDLANSHQSLLSPHGAGAIVVRDNKSNPIDGASGPSPSSPSTSQVSVLHKTPLTNARQSLTRALDSHAYSWKSLSPSAGASGIVATPLENSPAVKSHANNQVNSLAPLSSMPAASLAPCSSRGPISGVLEKSQAMNGVSASSSQFCMPSSVSLQSLVVSDKGALSSTAEDSRVSQLDSQSDALSLTTCTASTTLSNVNTTLAVSVSKISKSSSEKGTALNVSGALVQSSSGSTSSYNSGSTLQIPTNTANAVSGSNPGQGPFIVLDSATYMANKKGSLPIVQPNNVTLNHASLVAKASSHSSWVSAVRPATSSLDVHQSAAQLPAASSAPHCVHLGPTAAQKSCKQRKAFSKESGEQLTDCGCEVCHQTHDIQNAVDFELGPDGRLKCKYTTCRKTYSSKAGLWKHYYFHLLHGMKVPQEKASLSCDTFLPPQLSSLYRKARLRELFKRLTDEEIQELILPRLAKSVSLFELLECKSSRISRCRTISTYKMFNEFERFRKQVEKKLTEMIEQAEKDKNTSVDSDNTGVNEQESSEVPEKLSQPKRDIGETAIVTDEPVSSSSECTEKSSPSVKPVEPEKLESQSKDVSVNSVNTSCVEAIVSSTANSSSVGSENKQPNPISKLDSSLKIQNNDKGEHDIKASPSSSYCVLSVESSPVSKNAVCADSEQEYQEFLPVDVEHGSQRELGLLPRDLCNCEEEAVEEITSQFTSLEPGSGPDDEGSTLEATTKETCLTISVDEGLAQVKSEKTCADVNQKRCEETADANRNICSENKADVGSQEEQECSVIDSEKQRKVSQNGIENQGEDSSSTIGDAESCNEGTECNKNVTDQERTKAVQGSDKVTTKASDKEQAGAHKAEVEETKKLEERTEKQEDETSKPVTTSNRTGIIVEALGEDGTLDQTERESSMGSLENASCDRQVPVLDPGDTSLGSPFHSRTKKGLTSLSGTETANENESLAELDNEDVFGFRIPFMLKRAKLVQRPKVKHTRKSNLEKKIAEKATGEDLRNFILHQPRGAAVVVLEATTHGDKSFFRSHVMPTLLESNLPAFSLLGQRLLSQLFLTRKDYERIFRWGLGPKLAQVLGVNIFPTYKRIADFTKSLKNEGKGEDETSTNTDNADDFDVDESEMPAENDQSEDVYQGLPKLRKKRKTASKPLNEPNKKQKSNDTSSTVQNAQSQTEKKKEDGSSGEFTVEISDAFSAGIHQMESSLSDSHSQHVKNHSGSPIEAIMHVDSSQFSCMSQPLTKQGSCDPENTSAEGMDQNSEERGPLRFPTSETPVANSPPGLAAVATCGISSSMTVPPNATIFTSNAPSSTLPVVPLPSAIGAPLFLIPVEKVSTDLLTQFIKSGQESLQADSSSDKSKQQRSSVVLVLVPSTSSTGMPTIQTLTSSSQLETSGGRKPLLLIPSEKVPRSVVGQSNTVRKTMIITMVAGSGSKANAKTESMCSSSTNVSGLDSQVATASSVALLQTDATSATQCLRTPVMSPGVGEPLVQTSSPLLTEKPVLRDVTSSATSSVIPGDVSKVGATSTSLHSTSSNNADDPKMSVTNEVKNLTSVVRNTSAVNSSLESGLGSSCEHSLNTFSSCTTNSQVTQPSHSDIPDISLSDPPQTLGITVTVVTTVATDSDGQETSASSLLSCNSALTSVGDLVQNVSDFHPVDVVLDSSDRSFANKDKEGGTPATNAFTTSSGAVKVSPLNPPCDTENLSDSDTDEQSFNCCEEASFDFRGDHTYAIVRRHSPRKSVRSFKGNLERSKAAVSGSTSEDSDIRSAGHEYSLRRTSSSASGSSKMKEQSDDGTPPRKRRKGPILRSSVKETSVAQTKVPARVLRGSPSKARERK